MERFFNMDNKFFTFMSRVADLLILNILCVICCIPVFTAGASITAMFYVTLKMVRNEESYIIRGFFKSFRQNFRQATVINLIMLAAGFLLFLDLNIAKNMQGVLGKAVLFLFSAILLLYLMLFLYVYPVLSKFYNTIRNTLTNSFLMSIRHFPYTVLMLLISVLPAAVFFVPNAMVQSTLILLLIILGFAGVAYVNSYFFVKIFDKYIPKEDENTSEEGEHSADEEAPSV